MLSGFSPFNWTPEQVKKHDLHLRYKNAAERSFQREYRLLEQHFKAHKPKPAPPANPEPKPEPEPEPIQRTRIMGIDPNSPTGYVTLREWPPREGVTYPCPDVPNRSEEDETGGGDTGGSSQFR
jgi:hypothetical protein